MNVVIAREVLILFATTCLAAVVLLLAGLIGIAFMLQTYLVAFLVLYGIRALTWASRTTLHARRGAHS